MSNNKYRVLVIEDDENINNLVTTLLEANGYKTIAANTCRGGQMMFDSDPTL